MQPEIRAFRKLFASGECATVFECAVLTDCLSAPCPPWPSTSAPLDGRRSCGGPYLDIHRGRKVVRAGMYVISRSPRTRMHCIGITARETCRTGLPKRYEERKILIPAVGVNRPSS